MSNAKQMQAPSSLAHLLLHAVPRAPAESCAQWVAPWREGTCGQRVFRTNVPCETRSLHPQARTVLDNVIRALKIN